MEIRDETVNEDGIERSIVRVDVTARIVDKGGGIGRKG